jgi:uncharacterized protein YcbX
MPLISQIYLFPIKSCGGYAIDSVDLETRGFVGDRRYMLIDERGLFLTQRIHPRMALIRLTPDDSGYTVSATGHASWHLPIAMESGDTRRVTVWRDEVDATVASAEINNWFSTVLDVPAQLVYMNDQHGRGVKSGYGREEDDLSFADGAPVLLISTESLGALNQKLDEPVEMIRFRPNLIAQAGAAFAEDSWRRVAVGEASFDVEWPCTRCSVPTVDPVTGKKDALGVPLRTLNTFRKTTAGTTFGQNLIPRRLGRVSVGDSIEIIESQRP